MTFIDTLYNIIIMPIQNIVEMTYSLMSGILGNKGFAIIAISLVIQTLILPLYKRADALQEEEMAKQKAMAPFVNHIKRTFKGDERFMMLSTYYRQQDYKMWYPLKSSISILLQVPFFIAAYNYLSKLQELNGVSFAFIRDLSEMDALFNIGGFTINILPILMTVFNLISCVIYTKGMPVKTKAQGFGLAFVFLVILYNSPSGLVLYWTCNNLYSLLKNVFMKLIKFPEREQYENTNAEGNVVTINLVLESLFMIALLGGIIPLTVIKASPTEFSIDGSNPLVVVGNSASVFLGFFILWTSVFYYLMSKNNRCKFTWGYATLCILGILQYLIFAGNKGKMSSLLKYDEGLLFSTQQIIASIFVFFLVVVLMTFLYKRNSRKIASIITNIIAIATICMIVLGAYDYYSIDTTMAEYFDGYEEREREDLVNLSTNGRNEIFVVVDMAIGNYAPYIMEENPDLRTSFDGFTYYPNTISFGPSTNFTVPSLYAGYEYTPEEMNKRDNEKLEDKHNEALKVLPRLYSEHGFNVTVCDPPYAGYQWWPDLSIYDDLPEVRAYNTNGAFNAYVSRGNNLEVQKGRFIYYSLSKILPVPVQMLLYKDGKYCCTVEEDEVKSSDFLNNYYTLQNLDKIVKIEESNSDNLLMFYNALTHWPEVLSTPEYEPRNDVNVEEELSKNPKRDIEGTELVIETERQLAYYQTNVLTYKLLANWFQYLKDCGVYDNTRIVIASDHGFRVGQFPNQFTDEGFDTEWTSPLLMVKDFNSHGEAKADYEYMTNADVATILVDDIIEEPINPYTGNIISNRQKYNQKQLITASDLCEVDENNGYRFDTHDAPWYSVHDNKFDMNNWEVVPEPR